MEKRVALPGCQRHPASAISYRYLLPGLAGLAVLLAAEYFYWDRAFLQEGWPRLSLEYFIRSNVLFISLGLLLRGLAGDSTPRFSLQTDRYAVVEWLGVGSAWFFAVAFVLLFVFRPALFSELCREDGPVEWGSALFYLIAAGLLTAAAIPLRKHRPSMWMSQWSLLFIALAAFLVAMEEISWFQRLLQLETPDVFADNLQQEMNLHNFATNQTENLYYLAAFLFFILLPFLYPLFADTLQSFEKRYIHAGYFALLVPRPFIMLMAAVAFAYNFDMWDILPIQASFHATLIVLLYFAWFSSAARDRGIALVAILIVFVSQSIFLGFGAHFRRMWDVTEYKEFLIPLALMFYTLDVHRRVSNLIRHPAPVNGAIC